MEKRLGPPSGEGRRQYSEVLRRPGAHCGFLPSEVQSTSTCGAALSGRLAGTFSLAAP